MIQRNGAMVNLDKELIEINEKILDQVLVGLDASNKSIALLIDRVRILELRVLELEREAIRESNP